MAPGMASVTVPADHNELVEEMQQIEKLPVGERIKLAQKRRKQQLSIYGKWMKTDTTSKPAKQKNRRGIVFSPLAQLMEAATRGSIEDLRALLKSGADPNMKNHDGLTALHQCCIDGSSETVALLLKYGADVNVTDQDLWTPLHAAATCGHFKVVTMLVKAGADVTVVNGDGDMPHDITEEEVTLQYLKNEMMKRNISTEDLEQIRRKPHDLLLSDVESVLAAGDDLNQRVGQKGETFLHVAIAQGHNDIVKLLLDKKASATVEDNDGWQPVHLAAYWNNEEALELLATDSTVNFRAETKDGDTPYELCDDHNLKLLVLHILKDRHDSSACSQTSYGDDGPKDVNATLTEDTMDTSPPPTVNGEDSDNGDDLFILSVEDAPPSPLINIEAPEHSDRRSSIKEAKHNAPLKRQVSERRSNRERESVTMEALKPLMVKELNENTSTSRSVPSLSPDNYQEFYEAPQPTTQTSDPVEKQKVSSDSESDSNSQSYQPTIDTPHTASETPSPTRPEDIAIHETPEASKMKTTDESQAANSRLDKRAEEEVGDGLMMRPKKKKPAPPPPRGSLLDLKRQRSEEREHRLQQGNTSAGQAVQNSNFYQGSSIIYEAPPSPSMIRYKYKMVPDDGVRQTIFKQKKCIVM
ncbi:protein phosphatase 1 regulatory subunit 16A-like isoform X1 [Eriocheir sinensis]|uniref:protein phosphatase 1 regulatory subunit 16A-like isoform X1 n=1 Tax=Eriocheir sinensis TaxID=95602 RepID=UPI0021C7812A|nr:protein phosphatase 1 regulatory subunit 16A-like isoform X1 [Eriocheir sinensis]